MKEKNTGAKAFEAYYASRFLERWQELKKKLLSENRQLAYSQGLLKPYYLDYASVAAAKMLPPCADGRYLDMCAAPGGKTLVLLNGMGQSAELTANEISAERRNRLIKVLKEHVDKDALSRVRVTGFNACLMPRFEQNAYDRILLDAPCSSERHVLQNEKYLKQWSPARIKNLAYRQWALLSAAFLLLKPCGFVLYVTCALSDEENDAVVKKLLLKYGEKAAVQTVSGQTSDDSASCEVVESTAVYNLPFAEKTEFGYRFLPDTAFGAGPIYCSLIQKTGD